MKRKAEKENELQEGHKMKKARLNPVAILSDQNEHFEKKPRKLGSPITKVLRSLNADVGRDYYELLYNFLPGDQRGRAAEIAAFCHFVQERQQIFLRKSSQEKMEIRESIFQGKFFTNIYREADTGTKYLRRKILSIYDVVNLKTEEVQDVIYMIACYR